MRRLVERVAAQVDRPAQDAEVEFPSLEKVDAQAGLAVDAAALRGRVEQALTVPGVNRSVEAPVNRTQPKVTRDELAKKYPVILVADRPDFQLKLYKNLRLVHTYTVAVGAVGFDTPAGLYHIQNKAVDPAWTVPHSAWAGDLAGKVIPAARPTTRSRPAGSGIFDGAGIHGTDETYSLGHAASHGCIRMAIPDVIELYRPGPGRHADLHRLSASDRQAPDAVHADRVDRHLLPPCSSKRVWRPVCRMQSVPMKTPRIVLAQHRVPHGGRVAGPLDRGARARRLVVLGPSSPASAS